MAEEEGTSEMENIDVELEKEVLSVALNDESAIPDIAEILKPEHFGVIAHKKIFGLILSLHKSGVAPDIITLADAISKQKLDKVVSVQLIAEITGKYISSVNVRYNSRLVYEYWVKREAKKRLEKALRELDKSDELFEFLEQLERDIKEYSAPQGTDEDGAKPISEEIDEYFAKINEERISGSERGLRSKFFPTFNKVEGIRAGNIIAISGKYKSGKTTFAVALALDFAMQGKGVGIVSLEMSKQMEVYPKIISMSASVPYGLLRNPSQKDEAGKLRFDDEMFERAKKEAEKLRNKKIFVADKTFTATSIERLIRNWATRQGVDVVFVDYIGLVAVPRKERRDLEVAAFSRQMKLLAKELDIVVALISQENDFGETAESKGLARDADYWFRVTKPANEGEKTIKVRRDGFDFNVEVDSSLFKVTLKEARHTESGWSFLCKLLSDGQFVEYDFTRENVEYF